ncbi:MULTISPECIES: outer membrane protein assembly factor BamB family protein [unclassified Streptomyces]|uniref:outer membrane protein assembly factor BamB family protein n=1 Tax=unclassified Streptomyces TaxID=2593676 RepID=UPI00313C5CE1
MTTEQGDGAMSRPPGQRPPEGEFGAPYDPPAQPGYGFPPQGYAQPQPGPYQQPGPYAQPGSHQLPTQQYAAPAPRPPRGGPFRGRTAKIVGAVLAVALLAGGGIWFATAGNGDDDKPVAGPSHSAKPTAAPSPTGDGGKGKATGEPVISPEEETRTINAGAGSGEAKVRWLQRSGVDLPRYGDDVFGPWFAGDTVVRAMFYTVSGYSMADGTELWSLRLPTRMCGAPSRPTEDGKIVLGLRQDTTEGSDCDTLQMVDMRTGKLGWRKSFVRKGLWDGLSDLAMAINGDTVTVGRTSRTEGFRVSDGKRLFGERTGTCQPFGLASGPVALAAVSCHTSDDQYKNQRLERIDPATGKTLWTYKLKTDKDWEIKQIYSADPPIVSLMSPDKWAVIVLNADGSYRSRLSGGPGDYEPKCDDDLGSLSGNLDNCLGVAADANTFYLKTKTDPEHDYVNKVAAFDLSTGKFRWSATSAPDQPLTPLRVEDGKLLMYVQPGRKKGGGIATLPATGGTPRFVLRHPASGAEMERGFFDPRVVYADGRSLLVQTRISGVDDGDEEETRSMVAFGN